MSETDIESGHKENKKERREHAGKNDQARGRKKKTVGIKQSLVGQCISIMSDAIAVPFSIDSSIVVCARISVVDGRDKEIVHEAQPSLILPLTDAGLVGALRATVIANNSFRTLETNGMRANHNPIAGHTSKRTIVRNVFSTVLNNQEGK